jgi:hypothetical protein
MIGSRRVIDYWRLEIWKQVSDGIKGKETGIVIARQGRPPARQVADPSGTSTGFRGPLEPFERPFTTYPTNDRTLDNRT